MKKTVNLLLLFALTLFSFSCTGKSKYHFDEGQVFHTYYHIKYECDKSLKDTIVAELDKFNSSLNPFLKNSVIDKVNNNVDVEVDSFFKEVFVCARHVSEKTGGMFDVTCAPLVNLWGFGFENFERVDSAAVDSLLQFVGYQRVSLTPEGHVQKDDQRIKLNMSAIAKGYAVEVVCRLLEHFGVKNYMCEIGGEVRTLGVNPAGEPWNIGINKPVDDNTGTISELQIVLALQGKSIATSGDYRNFYYGADGKKYAHTINPKTGYPAEQNILSATVIADDCMTADAYATAFMTMGLENTISFLEQNPNILAYLIFRDNDGRLAEYCSDSAKSLIVNRK